MKQQNNPNTQQNKSGIHAINFISSTMSDIQNLKQQKDLLKTAFRENQEIGENIDLSLSIHEKRAKKIEEKKAELLSKQKQLIALQKVCIDLIQNPIPEKSPAISNYLIVVSVLTKIQDLIVNLTASAVDNHSIAINIVDIFPIIESFNHIFDTLESNNIIHETPNEKEKRTLLVSQLQDQILPKLQGILGSLEEEDFLEEENDNEDDVKQSPKVVEVEPAQEDLNEIQTNNQEPKQDNDQIDSNTADADQNVEAVPTETESKQ